MFRFITRKSAAVRRRPSRAVRFEQLESRRLLSLQLQFDYSLDSSGFMTASRRSLLESTLNAVAGQLDNTLAAVPSFTVDGFPGPSGSFTLTTSVPANTLKIYVFGASLTSPKIGEGGSSAPSGNRGEASNVYAPAVAFIEFSTNTGWYFGSSTTSGVDSSGAATSLAASQDPDFVTVATHEFLHGLGFNSSDPVFASDTQNGYFVGPNAEKAYHDSPVPLSSDKSHIVQTTLSVMDPSTEAGTRVPIGALEWGFLKDIGWDVAPGSTGLYHQWDLFTGGESGVDTVEVFPSRGVYLMEVNALSGDSLSLVTTDGSTVNLWGVSTDLKLFDANGDVVASAGPTSSSTKASLTYTFAHGGIYYVGAGASSQSAFTFTGSDTAFGSSQGFILTASLSGAVDNTPQNIVSAITPISIGTSGYRDTSILTDVSSNVYAINTVAGHDYQVSTLLPSGGGLPGPAIISIYDGSGNKLAGMTAPPADSDVGGDYGQTNFVAPGAGPYYVIIEPYVGAGQISPSQASLSVSWGTITSSGEFSADGGRDSGSEYSLAIRDMSSSGSQGQGNSGSQGQGNSGSQGQGGGTGPIFEGEERIVVRNGRKASQIVTEYQLSFSQPLDPATALNTADYLVYQVKTLSHHRTKLVPVGVKSATLGSGGTKVSLLLGPHKKGAPLVLKLSGIKGQSGSVVLPLTTNL